MPRGFTRHQVGANNLPPLDCNYPACTMSAGSSVRSGSPVDVRPNPCLSPCLEGVQESRV